jgi:lambda family phage portal protein
MIGAVAPGWALRREQARIQLEAVLHRRSYKAGGNSRRTAGWVNRSTDANAAAMPQLATLRNFARDLRRNNGWARRAIQVVGNNTVGRGIKAKPNMPGMLQRNRDALAAWNRWATSLKCDHDGALPFTGIQRQVMEAVVESGECLVLREPAPSSYGMEIPLQLRVLESDYIDTNRHGLIQGSGNAVRHGIEFDRRGRRVAYWLYEEHPGGTDVFTAMGSRIKSRRVPAEDVLHIYRPDRPGQYRGVSWLCAAIAKLNDYDDYDDATLVAKKIAACYAVFVEDLNGEAEALGELDEDNLDQVKLEPGQITHLEPGQTVKFGTPPTTADHDSFSTTTLRRIASSIGITYEDMTGDYSKVNFSSARMARLAHWANVWDWRNNMLIPQLCAPVWDWVMSYHAGLRGWRVVPTVDWAAPPIPMLEPDKEGKAYKELIRSGVMTLAQAIAERGYDPEEQLREIAETNALLDELDIKLDSDPRAVAITGQEQPSAGGDDGEEEAQEDSADGEGEPDEDEDAADGDG